MATDKKEVGYIRIYPDDFKNVWVYNEYKKLKHAIVINEGTEDEFIEFLTIEEVYYD